MFRSANSTTGFVFLIVYSILMSGHRSGQEIPNRSGLTHLQETKDVGVRLWYLPPNTDLTPGPLIFLPVSSQDPRLDTKDSWILYVSFSDIHNVLQVLAKSNLEWRESREPIQLIVDYLNLPRLDGHSMDIAVSSPNGSATAKIAHDRVQSLISRLYCGLTSSRARESLAIWSGTFDCAVEPPRLAPTP
jgi:hypothetical protein